MNKLIASLSVAVVLLVAPLAAQAQNVRIAVVNAAVLLEQAPQAKTEFKRIEQRFSGERRRIEVEEQDLAKLEKKLRNEASTWTQEEAVRKARDFEDRKERLKSKIRNYNQDVALARESALKKLQDQMNSIILQVAQEGGYDLILSEGIVYASGRVDITDEVLKRLR